MTLTPTTEPERIDMRALERAPRRALFGLLKKYALAPSPTPDAAPPAPPAAWLSMDRRSLLELLLALVPGLALLKKLRRPPIVRGWYFEEIVGFSIVNVRADRPRVALPHDGEYESRKPESRDGQRYRDAFVDEDAEPLEQDFELLHEEQGVVTQDIVTHRLNIEPVLWRSRIASRGSVVLSKGGRRGG